MNAGYMLRGGMQRLIARLAVPALAGSGCGQQ